MDALSMKFFCRGDAEAWLAKAQRVADVPL